MHDDHPFNSKPITLEDLQSDDPWWEEAAVEALSPVKRRSFGGGFFELKPPTSLGVGSEVEMARIIHHEAIRAYGDLIFADGDFWVFEDTMWKRVPEPLIRRVVHEFDGGDVGGKRIKVSSKTVSGAIRETIAIASQPDFFAEPSLGLNARNGVVTISETGAIALREHRPDDRHRFTIEADYKTTGHSDIPEGSMLRTLIHGAFNGDPDAADKIDLVGELLGAAAYGLATRLPQPKACIFLGETASNGKSTIASLLSVLLPPGAVSSIPLGSFSDDARIVNLAGKAANIADELSGQAIQGEQFKSAVTGEPIEGRDLYKSAVTFRPRALILCTTNILPNFSGGLDRGLQRRLIVLPFFRTIPENEIIPDIADRIRQDELHLLLDFAIRGAQRLVRNRGYTIPMSSVDALNDWLMKEPVFAWFTDRYAVVDDYQSTDWIPIKTMYESFKAWCANEDIADKYVPSRENFSIRLCRQKGVHKRRVSTGSEVRGVKRRATPII